MEECADGPSGTFGTCGSGENRLIFSLSDDSGTLDELVANIKKDSGGAAIGRDEGIVVYSGAAEPARRASEILDLEYECVPGDRVQC